MLAELSEEKMEIQQESMKSSREEIIPQVLVYNKFGVLTNLQNIQTNQKPETSNNARVVKQVKCPPIIITQKIEDLKKLHKYLKTHIRGEYYTQYSKKPNQSIHQKHG
ncbi:hypothetical protein HHI36_022308 [Cryptolaemus montrouzieri]|uniref:Uncharacterized protein n=1 Tax=Cryptolaemus montrouzieri TaxID=559131 RepID=A0ABD2MZI3_9CUCU